MTPLHAVRLLMAVGVCCAGSATRAEHDSLKTTLVVVIGAPGEDTYEALFEEELKQWRRTASSSAATLRVVGAERDDHIELHDTEESDRDRLREVLQAEINSTSNESPLWLILIGHGSFDGRAASFNLRGPDVTAVELAGWVEQCRRPLIVVDTTAASGPFLTALSAPGRVIITATKSGQERSYARFGRFFVRRAVDPAADLDKDEQTSLFEAFLAAGRDTAEFYQREGRLMTEHPLLDDNGDGHGVRVDFFSGDQLAKIVSGEQVADGELARRVHLLPHAQDRKLTSEHADQRDRLEAEIAALRRRKTELPEDEYFDKLETLLVTLARLYDEH